jgi:hypothetical protein
VYCSQVLSEAAGLAQVVLQRSGAVSIQGLLKQQTSSPWSEAAADV